MADEFNPQGVDQTPQNNENPNNTQAVTDTAATEPIPDYASAKGESTVVSSSPASPAAPAADQTSATTPLYRPAPEYGA